MNDRMDAVEGALDRFAGHAPRSLLGRLARAAWITSFYARHPLGRRWPGRAVGRAWAWQLWRRAVGRPVSVQLALGTQLLCPSWSKMAGAWIAVGLHEPAEMLFAIHLLRPDDLFVDVGANLGIYTVLAARRGARVVAFEPVPRAHAALARNLALNGIAGNVRVVPAALADVAGRFPLTTHLESSNHLVRQGIPVAPGSTMVDVARLDDVLPAGAAPDGPALLKVDAEGADELVLAGAVRTLERARPAVIVEIWAGGRGVRELLEARGYLAFRYAFQQRALVPLDVGFEGDGYLIAVHRTRLDETRARLQAAAPVLIEPPRVRWWLPTEEPR